MEAAMTSLNDRLQQPDMVGQPDWRAAEILNAPDPGLPLRRVDVATAEVREIMLASGAFAAVAMAAENTALPDVIRGKCITAIETIRSTSLIETTDPAVYTATTGLLNSLVTAGIMPQPVADACMALADQPQSWAEHNGVEVTARTVGLARGGV
jgi:hypothetical protein